MTDKTTGLARLREPFEPNQINKLPKPYRADSQKGNCRECGGFHGLPAVHLDYVGHAALTDRLLEVDPEWSWEPLAIGPDGLPMFDRNGGLWIRLSICGVTRLGYGDAQGKNGSNAVKEAIGDALRNAGMRFGAALDLWHKGDLHEAKEEQGEEADPEPVQNQPKGPDWTKSLADAKGDHERLAALRSMAARAGAPAHYLAAVDAALHECKPLEGVVTNA
jgi:hypothetical protein